MEQFDDSQSIGSLGKNDIEYDNNQVRVLHINILSKSIEDIKKEYGFSQIQLKQLDELTNDKYLSLWNSAIYGSYFNRSNYELWKQKGEVWSDIKIGNTNSTISDIGCLITSISILIKKSDVPTKNIYPFNPGTLVEALNNNYGFDDNGNLKYYSINKLIPNFKYIGNVNLKNKSKIEKYNLIKEYYDKGYYISLEVMGAS